MNKYVLQGQLLSGEPIYISVEGKIDPLGDKSNSYTVTGYSSWATTFPTRESAGFAWQVLNKGKKSILEFKPVKLCGESNE